MLTYNEWFEQNMGIGGTPADYATEYALYYHTELSRPPKDVVEAIEAQKEIYAPYSNAETWADKQQAFKDGGKYGYSLASGEKQFLISEIMRLYEFILPRLTDKELADTIEQLHNFKKERNVNSR